MSTNKIRKQVMRGDESKFFRGEMMHCCMCKTDKQSDPDKSSNWTLLEIDEHTFYVCDHCFPGVHHRVTSERYNLTMVLIFNEIARILEAERGDQNGDK